MNKPSVGSPASTLGLDHYLEAYHQELFVHCYRMMGGLEDAEDVLQDTKLRALQRADTLKKPAALRAWLYKIATNQAINALNKRKTRQRYLTQNPNPSDPAIPLPPPRPNAEWIDPLPEFYLDTPERRYEAHQEISLAFLAALQHLPERQRAALILRDVLDWKAREVAEVLDLSEAAVNSALQRARASLENLREQDTFDVTTPRDDHTAALLEQYIDAWHSLDIARLIELLSEEVRLSMPPIPVWYQGRHVVGAFFEHYVFTQKPENHFKVEPTWSNGQPSVAVTELQPDGSYLLTAFHVLQVIEGKIDRIDDFLGLNRALFNRLSANR